MTHWSAADFPELHQVLAGYLHEDFPERYGTPEAALRAFHGDADRGERRRFAREAKRFLALSSSLEFAEVQEILSRLGCRWTPPSREALTDLLTGAIELTPTDPRS
ncbi:MAG: contact-dependent growth inhibition system immunity protein [Acidobacteriota bacterium]